MGTGKTSNNTKAINCAVCGQEYSPTCAWQQGRCPYHPATISITNICMRLQDVINFFKGKK